MKILSIDWDYFVEEDPMLDFGHRESSLFIDILWSIRRTRMKTENGKLMKTPEGTPVMEAVDLTKLLPFRGHEGCIYCLPCLRKPYRIGLSESHLAILQMLGDNKELDIVNIDAHHDIHYGSPAIDSPSCGNWGSYLVNKGRVSKWTQIYPLWRNKFPEDYSEVASWMSAKGIPFDAIVTANIRKIVKWSKVDLVFICRSGAWTPPDYDQRFNEFCDFMGLQTNLPVRS